MRGCLPFWAQACRGTPTSRSCPGCVTSRRSGWRRGRPTAQGCWQSSIPDIATELGEVLLGTRPGRRSREEITVYKSMGHAVEDLAAASLVYRAAVARNVGSAVEL